MGPFSKNFDYSLKRDHEQNSFERRDYESVNEKTIS